MIPTLSLVGSVTKSLKEIYPYDIVINWFLKDLLFQIMCMWVSLCVVICKCQCPLMLEAYNLSGTGVKGKLSDRGTGNRT